MLLAFVSFERKHENTGKFEPYAFSDSGKQVMIFEPACGTRRLKNHYIY